MKIFRYYYHGDLPVYPLPLQRPPDAAATVKELERLAAVHGRLFVVLWATDESDPARLVETWLDAHTFKSTDSWYGNVRLAMYASLRRQRSRRRASMTCAGATILPCWATHWAQDR